MTPRVIVEGTDDEDRGAMRSRCRLTVELPEALKRRLAVYAAQRGSSLSEVASLMIEHYLDHVETKEGKR